MAQKYVKDLQLKDVPPNVQSMVWVNRYNIQHVLGRTNFEWKSLLGQLEQACQKAQITATSGWTGNALEDVMGDMGLLADKFKPIELYFLTKLIYGIKRYITAANVDGLRFDENEGAEVWNGHILPKDHPYPGDASAIRAFIQHRSYSNSESAERVVSPSPSTRLSPAIRHDAATGDGDVARAPSQRNVSFANEVPQVHDGQLDTVSRESPGRIGINDEDNGLVSGRIEYFEPIPAAPSSESSQIIKPYLSNQPLPPSHLGSEATSSMVNLGSTLSNSPSTSLFTNADSLASRPPFLNADPSKIYRPRPSSPQTHDGNMPTNEADTSISSVDNNAVERLGNLLRQLKAIDERKENLGLAHDQAVQEHDMFRDKLRAWEVKVQASGLLVSGSKVDG